MFPKNAVSLSYFNLKLKRRRKDEAYSETVSNKDRVSLIEMRSGKSLREWAYCVVSQETSPSFTSDATVPPSLAQTCCRCVDWEDFIDFLIEIGEVGDDEYKDKYKDRDRGKYKDKGLLQISDWGYFAQSSCWHLTVYHAQKPPPIPPCPCWCPPPPSPSAMEPICLITARYASDTLF